MQAIVIQCLMKISHPSGFEMPNGLIQKIAILASEFSPERGIPTRGRDLHQPCKISFFNINLLSQLAQTSKFPSNQYTQASSHS